MALAMGAVSALLPKLAELLKEEYNLQKSAKQDLQYLQRELQSMTAALCAVGEVPQDELPEHDRLWASDVRVLSHEIQDLVESFLLSAARAVPPDGAGRFKVLKVEMAGLVTMAKARRELAAAVKDIKGQVTEVANRDERYRGRGGVSAVVPAADAATKISVDPRLSALYDNTKKVGLDGARDKIIKILRKGDSISKREPKILSIVGFGGLGKTTLAKVVYDMLRAGFDCTAFVPVSRNPDVRKVLKDLLFELDQEKYKTLNLADLDVRQLINQLRQSLGTKRYFIVVDDIWDINAWETIRLAFMDSNCGSRIITTTRNVDVAKACSSYNDDLIHKMKHLSVDDSKNLFYKRIFGCETGCPPELEQVSKDILKKCGGVPLAIITLASHLASNQQIKPKVQWLHLLKSIGRGLINGGSVEQMRKILSLSYLDLPSHLKTCLLYLSVFPEDYIIRRDRLIRRWIAEGFIQGDNLIEVGESYLNELLNRSMIEPAIDFTSDDWVNGCRVHDMMLDLLCDLSSEENLVIALDIINGGTPLQRGICRLSLRKIMGEVTHSQMATKNMSQVRSFTLFSMSEVVPLSGFRLLRVLDLEDCNFGVESGYINNVGNLLHLRYLGLRKTNIYRLPEGIEKLLFLQILDLKGIGTIVWPKGALVLRKLICLYLSDYSELPEGFRNLTSLEELTGALIGDRGFKEDLGHLIKLRVLSFVWRKYCKPAADLILVESLGKLQKLESLDIQGYKEDDIDVMQSWVPSAHLYRIVMEGTLQRLPTWISSLHLLSHLDIRVRVLRLNDIQILGTLPALDNVKLRALEELNFIEDREEETTFMLSADAFPRAKKCSFNNLILVPWIFAPGAMPMVTDLHFSLRLSEVLSGCDLDMSTRNLPSLRRLSINLYLEDASNERFSQAVDMLKQAKAYHPSRPVINVYYGVKYCDKTPWIY